jgi:hypothetical protein
MKVSSKGGSAGGSVTRVRVGRLRLRIPAGEARDAKALAAAVASRLALRTDELAAHDGQASVRVRVNAPAAGSRETLADSIAEGIAGARTPRRGGR